MSIYTQFCSYCELLADDVEAFSPYNMSTIAGFGKVGKYDPTYLEIIAEIQDCAQLVTAKGELAALFANTGAATGRLDSRRLAHERKLLHSAILRIQAAARDMDEVAFNKKWSALPSELRQQLLHRFEAAGLAFAAPAAASRPAPVPPSPSAKSGAGIDATQRATDPSAPGDPIYLSAYIGETVSRQIVPSLRQVGLRPISMTQPSAGENGWDALRRRIASCRGGVMRLSEDAYEGEAFEIREGLKLFPARLVILGRPDLLENTKMDISQCVLFPFDGHGLSETDRTRLATLLSP